MKKEKNYQQPEAGWAELDSPLLLVTLSASIEGHVLDLEDYEDEYDYWE
ncbi:MAG: hypothetical protein IJ654_09495 [Bacteroidales bacterium]|nr:hypothetical protein [Bacteroidales bacterium]